MADTTPAIRSYCETLCEHLTARYITVWGKQASYSTEEKSRFIRVMCDPAGDLAQPYDWGATINKRTGDVFYTDDRKSTRYNLLDDESRERLYDHADPGGWCLYAERYRSRYGRPTLHNYRAPQLKQ